MQYVAGFCTPEFGKALVVNGKKTEILFDRSHLRSNKPKKGAEPMLHYCIKQRKEDTSSFISLASVYVSIGRKVLSVGVHLV